MRFKRLRNALAAGAALFYLANASAQNIEISSRNGVLNQREKEVCAEMAKDITVVEASARYSTSDGKEASGPRTFSINLIGPYGFTAAHVISLEDKIEEKVSALESGSLNAEGVRVYRKNSETVLRVPKTREIVKVLYSNTKKDRAILKFPVSKGKNVVYTGTERLFKKGRPIYWAAPEYCAVTDDDSVDKGKLFFHRSEIVSNERANKNEYISTTPFLAEGFRFIGPVFSGHSGQMGYTDVGNKRVPLLVITDNFKKGKYAGTAMGNPVEDYIAELKRNDKDWAKNIRILPLPK